MEQLSDLSRQAQLAAAGQLLDWLRLLTQLQPVQRQQQQERQRLLRSVVELRAQMQVWVAQSGSRQQQQQQGNKAVTWCTAPYGNLPVMVHCALWESTCYNITGNESRS